LNEDNLPVITSICAQLDGLPLAIELIAARMRLMSPQDLLERLNSQYILSADGMRAESARQKTLHNAIGWSYNLLSPDEKNLFAYLAVFAGGFTLDAAEAIFSHRFTGRPVVDLIALLLDKSLLQRTPDAEGEFRYDMLVTIQHFALNGLRQMGLDRQVRDWHLAYFLDLAEKADREIHGPNQIVWMDRIESESDNFHAAFEWCLTNRKTEVALRLLGALWWSWTVRGHYSEMQGWFDKIRALPQLDDFPALHARLLNHAAQFKWMLGDFRDAKSLLEQSRGIWLKLGTQGEQGLAKALDWLGMVARWGMGDNVTAQPLFDQSYRLYQAHDDQIGMAESMFHLAIVQLDRNNVDAALSLFEQNMSLYRQLGDLWGEARVSQLLGQQFLYAGNYERAYFHFDQHLKIDERLNFTEGIQVALCNFGNLYRYQGEYAQAEQFYEKSLLVCREHGLKDDISNLLFFLGLLALHQNDYPLAARRFVDFFNLAHTILEKTSVCDFLSGLASVAGGTHQPERAARLSGAVQMLFESIDIPYSPFDRAEFDRHVQMARDQIGEAAFEALAAEGRAMSMEQSIAYALAVG
jgi:tetratricopeptide (TPR) repeat protein